MRARVADTVRERAIGILAIVDIALVGTMKCPGYRRRRMNSKGDR